MPKDHKKAKKLLTKLYRKLAMSRKLVLELAALNTIKVSFGSTSYPSTPWWNSLVSILLEVENMQIVTGKKAWHGDEFMQQCKGTPRHGGVVKSTTKKTGRSTISPPSPGAHLPYSPTNKEGLELTTEALKREANNKKACDEYEKEMLTNPWGIEPHNHKNIMKYEHEFA